MISRDEAEQLLEGEGHLFTRGGNDMGRVLRVYLDDYSGWPSFCTVPAVRTHDDTAGATSEVATLVALHEADLLPGGVLVDYDLDLLAGAPTVHGDHVLTPAEEDSLFDYYGVPIEGVSPVVDHLGSALVAHDSGGNQDDPTITERSID